MGYSVVAPGHLGFRGVAGDVPNGDGVGLRAEGARQLVHEGRQRRRSRESAERGVQLEVDDVVERERWCHGDLERRGSHLKRFAISPEQRLQRWSVVFYLSGFVPRLKAKFVLSLLQRHALHLLVVVKHPRLL